MDEPLPSASRTTRPRGNDLVLRYAAFAAVSTLVNLSFQVLVKFAYHGPYSTTLAMVVGTVAGLIPKYLLDKWWIFNDQATGLESEARKFTLYVLLAVFTTCIFWVTEYLFDWLGGGGPLRYVGAIVGLGLGYWMKYRLDREFVFVSAT